VVLTPRLTEGYSRLRRINLWDLLHSNHSGLYSCEAVCFVLSCISSCLGSLFLSALTGFVRSYGSYLPSEKITLNAANPNVVRTNISTGPFYESLAAKSLLTPIEGVVEVFEKLLGDNATSGGCFEIGPNYETQGIVLRHAPEFLDTESKEACDLVEARGRSLQLPV